MRALPAAPACLLVALAASGASRAQLDEANLTVTNTTVGEAWTDNENGTDGDDNYGALINRLNIQGGVGDLGASARVDAMGFLRPPDEGFQNQALLERFALRYGAGPWTFEVGDSYHQLGRGIVLSVRKLQEAGVDIAIRGAQARYTGDLAQARVFVGTANTANLDPVSRRAIEQRDDWLAGGSYELQAADRVRVGFIGLYNQPEERLLDTVDLSVTGGTYILLPVLDVLSFYFEADAQQRYLAGALQQGSAIYGQSTFSWWDITLLAEWLFLNQFEQLGSRNSAIGARFAYNIPPTLERIDQEVLNNRDVLGGRLRGEYYASWLPVDLVLYLNGMYRISDPFAPAMLNVWHGIGGFELAYEQGLSRLAGALGYRHEQAPDQPEPLKTLVNLDVDLLQAIGGGFSIHLTSNSWFRTFEGAQNVLGSTFIGLERAGLGALSFELGYDTFDRGKGVRNLFYAAIASWEVNDELHLKGVVGNQRGGIKCVAGVCREYPAFSGARMVAITRF